MAGRKQSAGHRSSPPGRLRIVAGKWRGRVLRVADVKGLRPTPERIRETLFNWLAPTIEGAHCLDLYAGSGALGFEALSRGAASAVFVEQARPAVQGLQKSADMLGASDAGAAEIIAGDARVYLRGTPARRFDIVFLDPPYADESTGELCRLLVEGGWLAARAFVYFEQDRHHAPPELPAGLTALKEKNAGQVRYALAEAAD